MSNDNFRERLGAYLPTSSIPPVTNSTRTLLKSKLAKYEEQKSMSKSIHKSLCSSSTDPITMSFRCAKGNPSSKKPRLSVLKAGTNKKIPSIAHEEEISSFTLDEQEVNSMEVEISVGPMHKEVPNNTDVHIATTDDREPFKTYVFFDIEATGLKSTTYKPRITEMSFVAINHNDFLSLGDVIHNSRGLFETVEPRVLNKLTVCINPMKMIMPNVTDLTGLDNYNLEHYKPFSTETVQLINQFLKVQPQPVCLVAHNGFAYDYPLLQSEIQKILIGDQSDSSVVQMLNDIKCLDSLKALREICKNTSISDGNQEDPSMQCTSFLDCLKSLDEAGNFDQNEAHSHVETLEETQCPSVTSTPLKNVDSALAASKRANSYYLPITPDKTHDKLPSYHNDHVSPSSSETPITPTGEQKLLNLPKVESNFDNEIILTTKASPSSNQQIKELINHYSTDEFNNETFITPDKPDKINSSCQPPPPPRHSGAGKKRFVTHTNLSEVVKAKKKLDFSATELSQDGIPTSFSLPKLYYHWFKKEPDRKHGAEYDCITLMRVCAYKGKEFVKYANENDTAFSKIKAMW